VAKKRANGEGTVYPRKDKNGKVTGYRGSYWAQTANGPKRRYVSGKTKSEALAALRKAAVDRDGGLVFDAQNLTLGNYLDRWINDSVRDTVRQRTWERYEQIVRVHLKPTLGRVKLKALTTTHVRGLYREKLDSGLAPRTVQYIHTTLHKALKDAVADGLIPRNVTDGVKAPKPNKKEFTVLNRKQARAFLEAACGDRFQALYVLALHRGLREGELLGLRWEDVDFEAGTLSVRRTLSLTKEGHIFEPPKNGTGRCVKLTASCIEALKHHRVAQNEERLLMGSEWRDMGLVFPNRTGRPMHFYTLTGGSFKRILRRAGLPHIRLHDLRHTCATLLLSKGVHPKLVQTLLGHKSIKITLDTYSHVLPELNEWTAEAMEEALG
jgi:integrase